MLFLTILGWVVVAMATFIAGLWLDEKWDDALSNQASWVWIPVFLLYVCVVIAAVIRIGIWIVRG